MKVIVFIGLILITFPFLAQQNVLIQGRVTDAATTEGISECLVQISGTNLRVKTDIQGNYQIRCKSCSDSTSIVFNHLNYFQESRSLGSAVSDDNHYILNVQLQFTSYILNEVNISNAPDTIWGDEKLNVADFAFMNNRLMLLTYDHELRWKKQHESHTTLFEDCQLILLDSADHEISRCHVPDIAIKFYTKYLGEVFLQCRNSLYYVWFDEDKIRLEELPYEEFKQNYEPVIDTTYSYNYLSNYSESFPEFYYMRNTKGDSLVYRFRRVLDEQMMEIFRSEYKYLDPRDKLEAFRYELKTGIDKEIVGGYMSGFANSIYYHPLNAPMFLQDDTLTMFDHHHDQLIRFNKIGEPIDSAQIRYHLIKKPFKWSEKVLRDKETRKFYTYFMANGMTDIMQINVESGTTGKATRLTYPHIEKIRIRNGWAYYVYRPFESLQTRFLYRERIY
ncbi:MAG: carboxypeptidase-like regulatory domain-containing protein [Flavobacteriales bacterium]|nr:carboxypeptidase-like regulatory domain-containing protein [Flavobacteriales bacterium]